MAKEIILVVAASRRLFLDQAKKRFQTGYQKAKINVTAAVAETEDGKAYIYVSEANKMNGYRNVKVEFWEPWLSRRHDLEQCRRLARAISRE